MYVCWCVCSAEGKNGFDTEIKLGIVTRHCLSRGNEGTSERDGGKERKEKREGELNGGEAARKKGMQSVDDDKREGKRYFFRSCQRG